MAYVGTYRALLAGGVSRPALVLDFIGLNVLDRRITFSRGSNATLVDSTGKITYAPANLLTYSEQFDNAAWTKTRSSISANATTAPDGTTTADKLIEDTTATSTHFTGYSTTVSGNHVASAYLKAAERTWAAIVVGNSTQGTAFFDLGAGTVGTVTGGYTAAMTAMGNGWYRCSISGSAISSANATIRIYTATADNTNSYTGNGTSGIYLWGAQLEPVTYQTTPGVYQATTSSAYYGPRFDYDPVTLAAKGLLIEEQRTNLALYSAQMDNAAWQKVVGGVASAPVVTADYGVSPDGGTNADRVQFALNGGTTTTDRSLLSQAITISNSTAYTYSIWIKSLSGSVAMGIGCDSIVGNTPITVTTTWQRFTLTGTSTGTAGLIWLQLRGGQSPTQANAADVLVWGAQLEAGSFATSYIPTVASTVTRSADIATMTGANFSSWFNGQSGTFVASFDLLAAPLGTGNKGVYTAYLDANNIILCYANNSAGALVDLVLAGGVTSAAFSAGTLAANTVYKDAQAYSVNDFARSLNGAAVQTDTSGSLPVGLNLLRIGQDDGTARLNGHIRSLKYWNVRLPNSQLQSETS